jgi:2-dehydro-3-deoxyphosphogluconate aldolase/(4S)-4-hydroxy-2-oxoglutarate aldolase
LGPVIPVLVIERIEDAVPLARALVAGGVRVLEVTLRTPAALAVIERMVNEVEGAVVGAGTVTTAAQLEAVEKLGVKFAVSPGLTVKLAAAARNSPVPLLPGVSGATEVMTALDEGYNHLKLFPAEQVGGIPMLKALGGPFPNVVFCPTGGINVGLAPEYLKLANVACVGGSWLAPADKVAAGDWAGITALAQAAASLRG